MKRKDYVILNSSLLHQKVDVEQLNKMIDDGKALELINECESFYYNQVEELINDMLATKKRILFLAGPSSAGKTTSAKLIAQKLSEKGIKSQTLSLDDFLLPHDGRVILSNGQVDYESVFALDIPLIDTVIDDLIVKGSAQSPLFDMQLSERKTESENKVLGKNDILIVEGIHALNPLIIAEHNDIGYKVYLCPYDDLYFSGKRILTAQEIRMMRRCFRDCQMRAYTVEQGFASWQAVRKGEKQNIKPFKLNSDYFLNTSIKYEVMIYNTYFKPMLLEAPPTKQSALLISALDKCAKLEKNLVPDNSLLWEFMTK